MPDHCTHTLHRSERRSCNAPCPVDLESILTEPGEEPLQRIFRDGRCHRSFRWLQQLAVERRHDLQIVCFRRRLKDLVYCRKNKANLNLTRRLVTRWLLDEVSGYLPGSILVFHRCHGFRCTAHVCKISLKLDDHVLSVRSARQRLCILLRLHGS